MFGALIPVVLVMFSVLFEVSMVPVVVHIKLEDTIITVVPYNYKIWSVFTDFKTLTFTVMQFDAILLQYELHH